MKRWVSPIIVFSLALASVPAARAARIIKANVPTQPTSAPGHLGRGGLPVVVDSPLALEAPSLNPGSGVPVLGPHITESDKPGLKARVYAREVQGRENSRAAAQFLEDDETRSWLRENAPKRHRELFKNASGLNDLRLTLQTYDAPDTLRLALMARSNLKQAASPGAMLAWIDSDPTLAMYRERVASAFWEWGTLDEMQHQALARHNITADQWSKVSMATRRDFLRTVGRRMLAGTGVGRVPENINAVNRQKRALLLAWGAFNNDERHLWNDKLAKGMVAYDKLRSARKVLANVFKPGLRQALLSAESETDPDKALHLLKTVFDGVGEVKESRQIAKVAAPRANQEFNETHRYVLGSFLKNHLMEEIAGTQAGDMLLEFYGKRRLKISIKPLEGARFAQYSPQTDQIDFDEGMVTEFLRGRDMAIEEFFRDGKALQDLVSLLAPSFVHEATHQTQFQALADLGVPPGTDHWYDTTLEVEAFSRQTLFTHEKARTSERHRLLFIEGQNLIGATRSDVKRAQLLRDDPSAFRSHILGGYAEVKSLSGMANSRLHQSDHDIREGRAARRIMGAELASRGRLSKTERLALEKNGIDLRAWSEKGNAPVNTIKTSALRAAMRYRGESQDWVYDVYDYLRNRYAGTLRGVMTRLLELYPAMRGKRVVSTRAEMKAAASLDIPKKI